MRIENEQMSASNLTTSLQSSDFLIADEDKRKLTTEIEKCGGKLSFSENPLLNLPTKFIYNDIRNKFNAGFERWIYGTRELRIYLFPFSYISKLPQVNKFNKNSIDDILLYKQTSLSQPTRKNFLKIVEKRLNKGMSVYTYAEDSILQAYMWIDPNPQTYYGSGVDQEVLAVPNSVYVQDAYTNPFVRAKGIGQAGFCQLAHDAAKLKDKESLYLAVFGTNAASRHGVEKLGGTLSTSYFCKTRFGIRKTWKIEHE